MIPNYKNGFERHNIKWGSASAINQFIEAPDVFVAQRIFNNSFPFGSMPKRGQAVESGVVHVLANGVSVEEGTTRAINQFNRETFLTKDDKRESERENITPMIEIALAALKSYGEIDVPNEGQEKITMICKTEKWSLPIIGYLDFRFPRVKKIVDLKTTLRMPTIMSLSHQRQRAIYAKATGDDVEFLYVTPKKSEFKDDGNVDEIVADIKTHLIRMEKLLSLDEKTLREIVPVNPDSFYWRDADDIRRNLFNL